ncbi:MAG: chain-length determining protein [Sphingomonadales bacterium]|jgi:polysaccharide chain length determinant protein (PEP-CTERM system associated)|nr:chain-length determining protein [Sphingomonadales bacterium]MBK9004232.1 chain-length determining protein [Sphingomonadales bacterium]MBK9269409.1 chain-length determining protein [Sphingomonadales bacterium]MBP6433803.1 chain-length determining protein [Sphingorhabdus sp.]
MNGLYDELRIAVHSVWNRRWLALAIAWGVCLLGWLVVSLIPASYESSARIMVRPQTVLSEKVGITAGERRKAVEQLQQSLGSSVNLERVVKGTDIGRTVVSEAELASAISALRPNIAVKADPTNESVFTITAMHNSPRIARDVVQKLIDIAEEENISGDRAETSKTLKFLDAQLEARQKELQDAEAKRVAFETQNLGMLPGTGSALTRMEAARAEMSQIDTQLIQARSAVAALGSQLAGTPRSLAGVGGGGSPLASAQNDLASMKARGYTDDHPDVIAIRNQISILRAQGGGAAAGGGGMPNPAYASLQSMLAERQASVTALSARKTALQAEISDYTAKQISQPGLAAEYSRISQDYQVLKTQYDKLLADREAIRLRGQVETETGTVQFQVVDKPGVPSAPSKPNRPLLLALVLFAGLGAGAGTAFALGHLQTSFPTAAKLEKASGLPVIGAISQMLTGAQREERKRKMKMFVGGASGLVGVFALLLVFEFIQRGMAA